MTRTTLARLILAIVIAALLGGATLILASNTAGVGAQTPSGFFH